MLLTPASQPPPANLPGLERVKSATALKDTSSHNIPDLASLRISDVAKKEVQEEAKTQSGTDFLDRLSVPTVVLDTPAISHTMAAALSLSLLGHTLFLKNQVPFPVAQLARMPGGGSNPKVAKKREDLLATFDMLSSHLQTTFVALSTAYAKCKLAKGKAAAQAGDENSQKDTQAYTAGRTQRGAAHLMFILGPSVGAARARILLTIDGLDVKVWGERADAPRQAQPSADSEPEDDTSIDLECTDEEDEEDTDEDSSDQEEEGSEDEDEDSSEEGSSVDASEANTSDQEDELDELESESEHASIPPASRSPSLSPPPRSLAPSPESLASPRPGPSVLPSTCAPSSPSTPSSVLVTQSVPSQSTPHFQSQSPPSTQPSTAALSYAQEQAALRAAERLLSRTLMNAWADGGGDMASELAPTQTHVYLRAPRRFAHPAWLARQNLTRSLDAVLDAFLVEAGAVGLPDGKAGAKKSRGVRTEGAWIGCRGGSAFAAAAAERASSDGHPGVDVDAEDGNEEDEEIWWAWDGKIVGFADW